MCLKRCPRCLMRCRRDRINKRAYLHQKCTDFRYISGCAYKIYNIAGAGHRPALLLSINRYYLAVEETNAYEQIIYWHSWTGTHRCIDWAGAAPLYEKRRQTCV